LFLVGRAILPAAGFSAGSGRLKGGLRTKLAAPQRQTGSPRNFVQTTDYATLEAAAMNDIQLYIAAGLPTVAVLVGILMNVALFNSLSARLLALENKVDTKLDLVAGKLAELDSRLPHVQRRLTN
jgi:hypothetical protein